MAYWLFKSEPFKWSWEMQKAKGDAGEQWDGIRNYQARNNMRAMKLGDKAFFYHSNAKPSGIVGIVEVVTEAYTDFTQFDKKDPHYDARSKPEAPTWEMVNIKFVRKLKRGSSGGTFCPVCQSNHREPLFCTVISSARKHLQNVVTDQPPYRAKCPSRARSRSRS